MTRKVAGSIDGKPFRLYLSDTHVPDDAASIVRTRGHVYIVHVRPDLPDRELLETVLHELLHVADWSKCESWIGPVARDLARSLAALGWVRTEEPS